MNQGQKQKEIHSYDDKLFNEKSNILFERLGESTKMVLSTTFHDKVTSRTMSIIIADQKFYFQTDHTFRKYQQIMNNSNVALCVNNIQIEGVASEVGSPSVNVKFCNLYQKYFPSSYRRYTSLENERLFVIEPTYVQIWEYEAGEPYMEMFDFTNKCYQKKWYYGE